jgi:hypothetical protein
MITLNVDLREIDFDYQGMQFEFRPYAHVNGSEGVEANYAEE